MRWVMAGEEEESEEEEGWGNERPRGDDPVVKRSLLEMEESGMCRSSNSKNDLFPRMFFSSTSSSFIFLLLLLPFLSFTFSLSFLYLEIFVFSCFLLLFQTYNRGGKEKTKHKKLLGKGRKRREEKKNFNQQKIE